MTQEESKKPYKKRYTSKHPKHPRPIFNHSHVVNRDVYPDYWNLIVKIKPVGEVDALELLTSYELDQTGLALRWTSSCRFGRLFCRALSFNTVWTILDPSTCKETCRVRCGKIPCKCHLFVSPECPEV